MKLEKKTELRPNALKRSTLAGYRRALIRISNMARKIGARDTKAGKPSEYSGPEQVKALQRFKRQKIATLKRGFYLL